MEVEKEGLDSRSGQNFGVARDLHIEGTPRTARTGAADVTAMRAMNGPA